jgi:periplasmic protein TonB
MPPPMDFSFGTPSARSSSRQAQRAPRGSRSIGSIDMSLGPVARGRLNNAARGEDEDGGPDWRNLLSQWVAEHAYYPPQAARNGEEGDAKVHIIADHDGRVREVSLVGRSGSMWLDMALVALFRDAHIPPLPTPDNEPIEFNFTMRYILQRMGGY